MNEYTIRDNCGLEAVILPEKGATVVSLRRNGTEFLYCDRENLSSSERPRCGIPFLFPIFGRLQDGRYTWDEKEYAMEIHGFGHTSAWQVSCHNENTLTLVLQSDEHTLRQYPFGFRVTLTFQAESGVLTIHQSYENTGNVPMPYNYGFHPYFLTEKPEHIAVTSNADTLFHFLKGAVPFGQDTLTVEIPRGAPESGAALVGVHSPTVLENREEGRKLTMFFDPSFHTHVLWTQAGKPFLCVEPVNGSANGLNTGNHLTLAPSETKEAFVKFRAETI